MTIVDDIKRELREFRRFTGDGLPNAPTSSPLPVGDPQSGVHNPKKAALRSVFADLAQELLDGISLVNGMIPALEGSRDAALAAISSSRSSALTDIGNSRTSALTAIDTSRAAAVAEIDDLVDEAEGFKDAAAAYASDIVYASQVPIYSTKAAMPGLALPAGMNEVLIGARQALGDTAPRTSWVRVASEPDVPTAAKFRSTDRFLPNGATDATNGGWWVLNETRPVLDIFKPGFTPQKRLDHLQARMAAGETVKIACYGDSTVDGNATTGWTANAGGDHAPTAPNAWPSKLQALLRTMHSNNNIYVFNAGWSGQRLEDGWAYANYESKVIDNALYGVVDATIINFGLNDITVAGSQIAATISETRKLAIKVMAHGAIPILMACDPQFRFGGPDGRDHKESSRQIDAAKQALAADLAIPFIDTATDIRNWLSRNKEGIGWRNIQSDGLHFNDIGHAFKAGAIAKRLFHDTVIVEPGEFRRINSWDSKASPAGSSYDNITTISKSAQGGNLFYSSGLTASQVLQDAWVWNDSADTELIYRGIENEGVTGAGTTDKPSVVVTDTILGTDKTRVPSQVGFAPLSLAGNYRRSDMPYRFGHLPFGLSRVRYLNGTGVTAYCGNFELWPSPRGERNNVLKNIGGFTERFLASGANLQTVYLPEYTDGSNAFGLFVGDEIDILVDAVLPVGCGFIYAHSQSMGSTSVAGDKSGYMVWRASMTELKIYGVQTVAGITAIGTSLGSATIAGTADAIKFRLRNRRVGDEQKIDIYEGWTSNTSLLTVTRVITDFALSFAGFIGGLFYNGTTAGADKVAAIYQCWTKRTRTL